jgi:hypothetical protein
MDQHLFELAFLRSAERLIGMTFGGLAIFLGYKLFMNISQATESSAEVDFSGKLKVVLTRIGPGVFFALFGASIVAISYLSPVQVADRSIQNDSLNNRQISAASFVSDRSYAGAGEVLADDDYESHAANVRRSIRALQKALDQAAVVDLVQLRPAVQESKIALLKSIWQPEWGSFRKFDAWVANGSGSELPSDSLKIPAEMFNIKQP